MRSVLIRSRVGDDGMLHLDVPSDFVGTDVEVMVIVQPVAPAATKDPAWSPDFFKSVVGGWQGDLLRRESEGEYEIRQRP